MVKKIYNVALIVKKDFPFIVNDFKQAYSLIFKCIWQSINPILFPEINSRYELVDFIKEVRDLIKEANSKARRMGAAAKFLLLEALRKVEITMKNSNSSYVVLCDGLSIIEMLAIIYYFRDQINLETVMCGINPSGKTGTFKYLAEHYVKTTVRGDVDELTMRNIAQKLRDKLGCAGYRFFSEIDHFVHRSRCSPLFSCMKLINNLFNCTSKLINILRELKDGKILILADHGYDIITENMSKWYLDHRFNMDELSLSPITPIFIIGD